MKCLFIFLIIAGLFITKCSAQTIDWKQATNWRLYNIQEFRAIDLTIDSVQTYKSIPLNIDSMKVFMTQVEAWPKDKYSVWMGLYVVTCELPNKETRKIEVSVFGGFFYDDKDKKYYSVSQAYRDEWLKYFQAKGETLSML